MQVLKSFLSWEGRRPSGSGAQRTCLKFGSLRSPFPFGEGAEHEPSLMRLMGVFWLGLLGFSGAVLAQDRRIGFQDRSGTTHPGVSLASSRGGFFWLLGFKK